MTTATEAIYDVFVSHGVHDRGIAGAVRKAFAEAGLEVFAIDEVKSDETFLKKMRRAVAECHAFVLILTRSTLTSPNIAFEIGMAMAWNKPVYVLFDGIAPSEIPAYLREFHVVPISKLERVVREIRESQQPLGPDELRTLVELYNELAVPTDQLLTKPLALRELADKYNRSAHSSVGGAKLVQELIRLRKQGKLPRVGR
jgi:hypothetical protein